MEIESGVKKVMMDSLTKIIGDFSFSGPESDMFMEFAIKNSDGEDLIVINLNSNDVVPAHSRMIFTNTNLDSEFIVNDNFFIGVVTKDGIPNRFEFREVYRQYVTIYITGSIGDHSANRDKDLIFNDLDMWYCGDTVKMNSFIFNLPSGSNEYM